MFWFTKKLKALKPMIRSLAKSKIGNLTKNTDEAFNELCEKQKANILNTTPSRMEEEKAAYHQWDFFPKLEGKIPNAKIESALDESR